MIYLVQPRFYPKSIQKRIQSHLQAKQQHLHLSHNDTIKIEPHNSYFIINDTRKKHWNGLNTAKQIRSKDPKGNLILISNDLDYTTFFRYHLSFLDIIDLNNPNQLAECIDYITS